MKSGLAATLLLLSSIVLTSCNENTTSTPDAVQPGPAMESAASKEKVESEITQLENVWAAAIVKKDLAILEGLLSEDFVGTSPTGGTFSRSSALEDLTGTYNVEVMDLDEITVNVYGDTAVSFASQNEKSSYLGRNNSGHYHFTNVWIKRNGKWQVVASHGSPLKSGN